MASVTYIVEISRAAARDFGGLDRPVQVRIGRVLKGLATNPRPRGSQRLEGSDAWRVRAGDWRVLYTIDDTIVTVLVIRIRHRREVYR